MVPGVYWLLHVRTVFSLSLLKMVGTVVGSEEEKASPRHVVVLDTAHWNRTWAFWLDSFWQM